LGDDDLTANGNIVDQGGHPHPVRMGHAVADELAARIERLAATAGGIAL